MELYQIRYFLAVSRTLNFTRAAEECHVSQPSLTRAVQKLEEELGGALFRRERRRTHLTELGRAMIAPLQRSLESAEQAKIQAESFGRGEVAPLCVGVSDSVPGALLAPILGELAAAYPGLRLTLARSDAADLMARLEEGELELAIAAVDGATWARIDAWPLFDEAFVLCVAPDDPLADRPSVAMADLRDTRLVARQWCEQGPALTARLDEGGLSPDFRHTLERDTDLGAVVASGLGAGIAPRSLVAHAGGQLVALPIADLDLDRTVSLFAVAGRRYSVAAAAIIRLLRAAEWTPSADGA